MSRHTAYAVVLAIAYTLCFCFALPAFIDEAYTYNLATDPSLRHMLSALAHGADGSFPAYALFAFAWVKVFGASELSLRLTGGLFVVLFVWHSGRHLLRRFSPAAVGLALLLLLSMPNFIFYTLQARFYGMLLFLFSVVFWGAWEMVVQSEVSIQRRLWHGLACGLLCLSHPLGVVYGGIVALLYVGFAALRKSLSWISLASFAAGPACLLAWLPAFRLQRGINAVFPPGTTAQGGGIYWEFAFLGSWVLFGAVVIGAGLAFVRRVTLDDVPRGVEEGATASPSPPPSPLGRRRTDGSLAPTLAPSALASRGESDSLSPGERAGVRGEGALTDAGNRLLVVYALVFIVLLNFAVFLLDATHIIPAYLMQAVRYVLVAGVAYTVLLTATLQKLEGLLGSAGKVGAALQRALPLLLAAGLLAQMATSWSHWLLEKSHMESALKRLAALAGERHLPIVCEDHESAFFLTQRAGAADVKYVLAEEFPFATLMRRIREYYPQPEPISPTDRQQFTNDFVFLPAGQAPVVISAHK